MALGNGERYYSPGLGRFQQEDSFGGMLELPDTLNRHAYANNSPTNFIDPTGLYGIWDAAGAFWRGFTKPLEPLKIVADELVFAVSITNGVALKDIQFSSALGMALHNRLNQGQGVIGAGLGAVWDVGKGMFLHSLVPQPIWMVYQGYKDAKLNYDYLTGKISKDKYYDAVFERGGEATGELAVLAGGTLLGGAGAGAEAGAGAGAESGVATEIVESEAGAGTSIRPLTTGAQSAGAPALSAEAAAGTEAGETAALRQGIEGVG